VLELEDVEAISQELIGGWGRRRIQARLEAGPHRERTLREIGRWWMAIGGALEQRKFPVSCERVAFSRVGGSDKAAQIPEEGNGS
jgi:hypothetical protein